MSIKVAVVCGGSSVEHEVSVITAMQAAAALDRSKYTPIALYITRITVSSQEKTCWISTVIKTSLQH